MNRSHPDSSTLAALEQHLRTPALVPAPSRLHARVMARIEGLSAQTHPARSLNIARFALPAAACIASASAAALLLSRPNVPAAPQQTIAQGVRAPADPASIAMVDPAPIFFPAAQFLAASLDEHIANEARSVLDDTRAAADFVVSCLPFARGG
jgi:hypothetical protein